jgi:hypothetical protein
MNFDRTAIQNGQPLYEDLEQKVRAANAHADETHWCEDGINQFVWYAGNDQLAFYLIDRLCVRIHLSDFKDAITEYYVVK